MFLYKLALLKIEKFEKQIIVSFGSTAPPPLSLSPSFSFSMLFFPPTELLFLLDKVRCLETTPHVMSVQYRGGIP